MTLLDDRPALPALAPRRWAFVDKVTGKARMVTCMPGCESDHSSDMERPTHPEDIWCEVVAGDVHMPLNTNGYAEEFRVLGAKLVTIPFSRRPAERVPHAVIEFVDDHWMEGLDPEGLTAAIDTLAARVEQLRETRRRLIQTCEAHRKVAAHG